MRAPCVDNLVAESHVGPVGALDLCRIRIFAGRASVVTDIDGTFEAYGESKLVIDNHLNCRRVAIGDLFEILNDSSIGSQWSLV